MRSSQDTYTLANGVNVPCIGLGTYQSPDAVASAAVKDAMAAGYRLIDTAAAYGNERGVGQGIRISGDIAPGTVVIERRGTRITKKVK